MQEKQEKQDLLHSWTTFLETFQKQNQNRVKTYFEGMNHHFPLPPTLLGDAFLKAGQSLLEDPSRLLKAQADLLEEINDLWQKMLIAEKGTLPERQSDKRFPHEAWKTVPYFLFMKEYYLITSRWLQNLTCELKGLDDNSAQKVQFFTKQLVEALSPANFPFSNPEVLEELIKTNGHSLQKGMQTFLEDMESGKWMKMTDPAAFELGKNIAASAGDVVFRNELFELIHYAPLTDKQYAIPLLIIPPWINKFYIFDLNPNHSFVKWMLEQGHNVFILSWVNPGGEQESKTFEDYLLEGAYKACEVVSSLTQSPHLHTMGYCVGGNLLVSLAAYLAKVQASFSLQTMTLLTTVMDFSKVGDLRIFLDEEHLRTLEESMAKQGFLEADVLKSIFNLLRPNELVWSFFIKNYLLGQTPPAFDFLYWNSDSIRLPARLHSFILRKYFQENLLMKPGGIKIKDIPLDLRDITTPTFLLATLEDHISPWKSCYPLVQLLRGPTEFVLAGSGHVAGVMNPPQKNKYGFFTNFETPYQAEDWFEGTTKHEGSWWLKWNHWIESQRGGKIIPLSSYPSLEAAPGSYVRAS